MAASRTRTPSGRAPDPPDRLVYVHGGELGLRRERRDGRFVIVNAGGVPVTDDETLERVRALHIPPAWTDVWISAASNSHLQATGLDTKRRRQYLYHPLWRLRRDEEKFDDMLEFAARLPGVRAVARRQLCSDQADRQRTLALAIRLLDIGFFRVGWDRYARDNGHVGLTTLRRENVTLQGVDVRFDFIAKSGKRRRMTVRDQQSVRALADLKRRRGSPHELLVYPSRRSWHRIHAADVNNTLRCWGDGPYSAKEFRTWAATVLAASALAREHAAGQRGPRAVSRAVREVSTALGNTPAVARSSYIDPRVIDLFEDGVVIDLPEGPSPPAVPVRIAGSSDEVVIELPTDVDEDAIRLDVEHRVHELLVGARPAFGSG
jgi:DNA topoisomerase IB